MLSYLPMLEGGMLYLRSKLATAVRLMLTTSSHSSLMAMATCNTGYLYEDASGIRLSQIICSVYRKARKP